MFWCGHWHHRVNLSPSFVTCKSISFELGHTLSQIPSAPTAHVLSADRQNTGKISWLIEFLQPSAFHPHPVTFIKIMIH
jgi:hypothetical protein